MMLLSAPGNPVAFPSRHDPGRGTPTMLRTLSKNRSRLFSRLSPLPPGTLGLSTSIQHAQSSTTVSVPTDDPSTAEAQLLSPDQLQYLNAHVIDQLRRARVSRSSSVLAEWQDIVLRLALKAASRLYLSPYDSELDIRSHLQVLSIPGQTADNTCYVNGVLLLKNVTSKGMRRLLPLHNARVVILSFPMRYSTLHEPNDENDGTWYNSLSTVRTQETMYLDVLVRRLLALQPQLIVSGDGFLARYAVAQFERSGVVVVAGFTPGELDAIQRCTGAAVIGSEYELTHQMNTVGLATLFDVQDMTLVAPQSASEDVRTSFVDTRSNASVAVMKLQGRPHHSTVGSFLICGRLQASALDRVSQCALSVTQMAYNLRLEHEWAQMGWISSPVSAPRLSTSASSHAGDVTHLRSELDQVLQAAPAEFVWPHCSGALGPSTLRRFARERATTLSSSIAVPLPHAMGRIIELISQLKAVQAHMRTLQQSARAESSSSMIATIRDTGSTSQTALSHTLALHPEETHESHTQWVGAQVVYDTALARLEQHLEACAWFLVRVEQGKLRSSCLSTPLVHIVWLEQTTRAISVAHRICGAPRLVESTLYGATDQTLGQALDHLCAHAQRGTCPAHHARCQGTVPQHTRTYFHAGRRVDVTIEPFACPVPGQETNLLSWRLCKACHATNQVHALDRTASLSWAQMLCLLFYGQPVVPTASSGCEHEPLDQIYFFALHGWVVRLTVTTVRVHNVVLPQRTLRPRPDLHAKRFSQEVELLSQRAEAWWNSLASRLEALRDHATERRAIDRLDELCAASMHAREAMASEMRELIESLWLPSQPLQPPRSKCGPLRANVPEIKPLLILWRVLHDTAAEWHKRLNVYQDEYLPTLAGRRASYWIHRLSFTSMGRGWSGFTPSSLSPSLGRPDERTDYFDLKGEEVPERPMGRTDAQSMVLVDEQLTVSDDEQPTVVWFGRCS